MKLACLWRDVCCAGMCQSSCVIMSVTGVQDVEIKYQGHSLSFAFVQYDNIHSVVNALREMDGEQIGLNKMKVQKPTSSAVPGSWLHRTAASHNWSLERRN